MEFSNEKPRVTVRQIAHEMNVSHTTISRALRDDPRITPGLRAQVQRKAREMGYRPDPMLAALAHYRRSNAKKPISAGLAWINIWKNPKKLRSFKEFDLYWRGASEEAERSGFRLEEFILNGDLTPARLEKILLTRNIRGVLLPPVGVASVDWTGLDWDHFCIVRFGHSILAPRAHLVTSDQLTDGLMAYENIWKNGYRRIGLVTRPNMLTRFRAGYLLGEMDRNPPKRISPLLLPESGTDEQQVLKAWIQEHKPDAILTDIAQVPDLIRQAGFKIPGDLGIATLSVLDGNADAGIYQNSREIGRAAVQMLISLINHNESGVPEVCRELLIEGRWVNGSTLPPK
ncbi:MAG TPA: LacI family DNA-binding transcriptional regulator [Candidatus Paceibacterota bacterium]|nr:LacI family DNA-binding transcriptional regulator [Candidatus Paceibacterota bacterium]